MINIEKKYPCPCCGFLTMSDAQRGTFDICPVCYWEDDVVQFNDLNFVGGANEENLRNARLNLNLEHHLKSS